MLVCSKNRINTREVLRRSFDCFMCLKKKKLKKHCFKKEGKKIQQTIVKVEEVLGREIYSALLKRHSLGPQPHSPACSVPTALLPDTCALSQGWADLLTLLMVSATSSGLMACGTPTPPGLSLMCPLPPTTCRFTEHQPHSGRDEIVT